MHESNVEAARGLILAVKTVSADHRAAMVSIAAALPRSGSGSGTVEALSAALPGVAKDAREDGWGAIGALLGGAFYFAFLA